MKIKNKSLQDIKKGQGVERHSVLDKGGVWIKPTMVFEMKETYNRKRQKQELRKMMEY